MSAKICRLHPDKPLAVQWRVRDDALFAADEWIWLDGEAGRTRAYVWPDNMAAETWLEEDRERRELKSRDGFPLVCNAEEIAHGPAAKPALPAKEHDSAHPSAGEVFEQLERRHLA